MAIISGRAYSPSGLEFSAWSLVVVAAHAVGGKWLTGVHVVLMAGVAEVAEIIFSPGHLDNYQPFPERWAVNRPL